MSIGTLDNINMVILPDNESKHALHRVVYKRERYHIERKVKRFFRKSVWVETTHRSFKNLIDAEGRLAHDLLYPDGKVVGMYGISQDEAKKECC